MSTHTFSIDTKVNSKTGQPFGEKYAGGFTVRRPTLADKRAIAIREQQALGGCDPMAMNREVVNEAFIFAHLDTISEKRPDWCFPSKLYEGGEDEQAVYAVWQEVDGFLKTFR